MSQALGLEVREVPATGSSATSLVLLHEGLGSAGLWRDVPERLAAATGLRTIAYSRAGHGGSRPAPLPRPLDFMEREAREGLPALLDALDARDAILIGHSDGGSIALLYAAGHPAGLRGVVALAPHVFVEDVTVASIERARREYVHGDLRRRLLRHHGDNVDGAFLGWSGAWLDPEFRSWNIEAAVARIEVPLLVVQGLDDEYGTLAQVESIAARARGGVERLVLERCGHAPHRDQPERTVDAIAAFARRVAP